MRSDLPSCPLPPVVPFSAVNATGSHHGSRATYTCDAGYHVNGWAFADCWCTLEKGCRWTTPPACFTAEQLAGTPPPTPQLGAATCYCDPATETAVDVKCVLEEHRCEYNKAAIAAGEVGSSVLGGMQTYSASLCDGSRTHHSIRVQHTRSLHHALAGRDRRRQHKCQVVGDACRCCDCEVHNTTAQGCPCGAKHHLFDQRWQYGSTPYWWSFRPKPGTTTCEVRGEMKREGADADAGDVFLTGRVIDLGGGDVAVDGRWAQPSDPQCPSFDDVGQLWQSLEAPQTPHQNECGPMRLKLHGGALTGSWQFAQHSGSPWSIDWKPCGAKCFSDSAHIGSIFAASRGGVCGSGVPE